MSNTVRYDPLLVDYLANELNSRFRSRGTAAAPFFAPDLSVTLPFEGGEHLRIDLHPTRGWFRVLPAPAEEEIELDAFVTAITAPPDERILRIDLSATGRFRDQERCLVLELHTNQWNALLLGEGDRILNVLRPRRAGTRSLHAGEAYVPPRGEPRFGAERVERDAARARWVEAVEERAPTERRSALLRSFAWTGSTNADWILEEGADGFGRWWWLGSRPPASPAILGGATDRFPYPLRLEGLPAEGAPTLLAAMATLADLSPSTSVDPARARAAALARERLESEGRRIERLREELTRAGEAERLQGIGDLLLAKLHEVRKGAASVTLEDWEGERVEIPLDPALTPAENATRYYDQAGRKRRAEARLPELLAAAEAEAGRWEEALRALDSGAEIPPHVHTELARRDRMASATRDDTPAVPYRLFRTSGGLEVRVGRSAKDNDRLTFRASAPNDVWLHARSVPGSHVILRWSDPDASPPARDLAEAALIAAVFSRARTSGTVPVDWTRRKHVRKPRGAPPGAVIPQQVRTIFVEPDEAAVEGMRG